MIVPAARRHHRRAPSSPCARAFAAQRLPGGACEPGARLPPRRARAELCRCGRRSAVRLMARYAAAGYGAGPPRRAAAGEPARAPAAQAGDERAGHLLRAAERRPPPARDGLRAGPCQGRPGDRGRRAAAAAAALRWTAAHAPACRWRCCDDGAAWPRAAVPVASTTPAPDTPASVLYTSGTTGRPKGCVLSHRYELEAGALVCQRRRPGRPSRDGTTASTTRCRCSTSTPRSSPSTARCCAATARCRPTASAPRAGGPRCTSRAPPSCTTWAWWCRCCWRSRPAPLDRGHRVRFAIGAGVDPQRHAEFEQRFGFPLIEIWGMTEMVRAISTTSQPRQVGTRAFGRAVPGLRGARRRRRTTATCPTARPARCWCATRPTTPRHDFFSGYLDDPAATEQAWRGGWFHTGDIVTRARDGLLRFVDRRKNIIRRSGENIAAAEVEAVLQTHPWSSRRRCWPCPTNCARKRCWPAWCCAPPAAATRLRRSRRCSQHCNAELAYYKAPGWIWLDRQHPDHVDAEDPEAPDLRARRRPAHLARHGRPALAQASRRSPFSPAAG